jgi:ubiquinone/menaquinone biosynthesis C-methylase UbiE
VNVRRPRDLVRRVLAPSPPSGGPDAAEPGDIYEKLYEEHARNFDDADVVGGGDFEGWGRKELALLVANGLPPDGTLVDLGCGIGRLAVHAVPYLAGGHYVGTDVSAQLLDRAQKRLSVVVPDPPAGVTWIKQAGTRFAVPDESVDMFCAFSVFTHIEHEDTFNFLKDARRAVRPGGRFVFSCLPLDLSAARVIFSRSIAMDFAARWATVRNVVTSVDMMERLSHMAGWEVVRWYRGDEPNVPLDGELHEFGQSVCVVAPREGYTP